MTSFNEYLKEDFTIDKERKLIFGIGGPFILHLDIKDSRDKRICECYTEVDAKMNLKILNSFLK